MRKDYYKILEVDEKATHDEIKKAFRKATLKYHPDKNPDVDPSKMHDINEAWTVLSDKDKRQTYDLGEDELFRGFPGNKDFGNPGGGPAHNPNGEGFSHNYSGSRFNEPWFKNFGGRVHTTDHLNIALRKEITLPEFMEGVDIKVPYKRNKRNDLGENANIDGFADFKLNGRQGWQPINIRTMNGVSTYYMRFAMKGQGNEEVIAGVTYVGDVYIDITIKTDENMWMETDGTVCHQIDVNIGDLIFDEPLLVTTCCNESFRFTKFDSSNLNNIRLAVKEKGIKVSNGQLSDYVFVVNVVRPNTKNLTEEESEEFKKLLKRCEF